MRLSLILLLAITLGLSSCGGETEVVGSPYLQANAIKSQGGTYKIGKPYTILGQYYIPQEDYNYSEIGTASWYGKDFHAKKTANGEDYDMNTLTAAHRTLPMPSIVKVTNLENGRSLVLRVNDRGPFAKNRIIDISKRGAQLLGFQEQGTAKVKVEILAKESKALKNALLGIADDTTSTSTYSSQTYEEDVDRRYLIGAQAYVSQASTVSSTSTNKGIYVQAGSFTNPDTANDMSTKLKSVGSNFITPVSIAGRQYYRVRFGPFSSESEAQSMLNKVLDFGVYNAKVIHE
ncbi:MAG: septal ring lytic transglycosylase RlpA family protein [Lactobacillus sp.]|jgi:rare lipoprotein A|nr:septal ring lytic transglycosylase RlpA family protein [Lactobacillus sp.]